MDEPFKGLDDETKKTVMEIVRGMCKDRTVIFITHDQSEADYLADNTIRMNMV